MDVTVQSQDLKPIDRYLQERLQPQAQITPLQVQCGWNETLMVLVQHPPGNAPDPQQIFKTLEQAIASLPSDLIALLPSVPSGSRIKLFMRVLGRQKPYAYHHVNFPIINPLRAESAIGLDDPQTVIQTPPPPPKPAKLPPPPVVKPPQPKQAADMEAVDIVHLPAAAPQFVAVEMLATADRRPQAAELVAKVRSLVKPLLIASGVVAAAVFLAGVGYTLSRPCVVGSCTALETAQSLSQQSLQTLKSGKPEATQQAIQQLTEARQQVAEIPMWSSHHGTAQALQQHLDQILTAEADATAASEKGKAPAQPVTEWQATQALWQTAIAQLESVSSDSFLHPFAQERLNNYRANLAFTNQRIEAEQTAQQRLISARKAAELAIARQNVAQKPADWQQAQVTWQVAVNALRQIPNSSTAYAEARQLLEYYEPELANSRDRSTKEQLAQKFYSQATNHEKQAKALQQRNQWSQAVVSWQNALSAAKQIPNGTSVSESAQTLVANYTNTLQQAQTVMEIRSDLEKVCFSAGRICNYTITNEAIQIRFVPSYERKVQTIGGMSYYSGDRRTLYKVRVHLASLFQALQVVSTNAGIPIQVYDSNSELLGTLVPK